jgi:hypothetical protein
MREKERGEKGRRKEADAPTAAKGRAVSKIGADPSSIHDHVGLVSDG